MASRTAKGIYEGLGKISQETGIDFGITGMSEAQFKDKYFTGPGNLGILHDKLSKISDETGLDFGQGSKEEWLSSFGFGNDGKNYTVKKRNAPATSPSVSPASTSARAREVAKPQQTATQKTQQSQQGRPGYSSFVTPEPKKQEKKVKAKPQQEEQWTDWDKKMEEVSKNNDGRLFQPLGALSKFDTVEPLPTPKSPFDNGAPNFREENKKAREFENKLSRERLSGRNRRIVTDENGAIKSTSSYFAEKVAKSKADEIVAKSGLTDFANKKIQEVIDNAKFKFEDMTFDNTVQPILADATAGAATGTTVGSAVNGIGAVPGFFAGLAGGTITGVADVYNRQISEKTSPAAIRRMLDNEETQKTFDTLINGTIIKDGQYTQAVLQGARAAGKDPEAFVRENIFPQMSAAIEKTFDEDTKKRFGIHNFGDLFVENLNNAISWGLHNYASRSASARQAREEAIAKATEEVKTKSTVFGGEDENTTGGYRASAGEKIAASAVHAMTGAITGDFKTAHAVGEVAQKTVGRALQRFIPFLSSFKGEGKVMAEGFLTNNLATMPQVLRSTISNIPSGMGNLGFLMGTNSAMAKAQEIENWTYDDYYQNSTAEVRQKIDKENAKRLDAKKKVAISNGLDPNQVYLSDDEKMRPWTVWDDFSNVLSAGYEGTKEGVRFHIGMMPVGMASNIAMMSSYNTLQRGLIRTGTHLGNIGAMVGMDYLSEGSDFRLTPSLSGAIGMEIGLYFGDKSRYKRTASDIFSTAARVRARGWKALTADTPVRGPRLTDDELSFVAQRIGINPSGMGRTKLAYEIARVMNEGPTPTEGKDLDMRAKYGALFNKYLTPFSIRQKLGYSIFGDVQSFTPLYYGYNIIGDKAELRAKDGELIDVVKFDNKDELDSVIDNRSLVSEMQKLNANSLAYNIRPMADLVWKAYFGGDKMPDEKFDEMRKLLTSCDGKNVSDEMDTIIRLTNRNLADYIDNLHYDDVMNAPIAEQAGENAAKDAGVMSEKPNAEPIQRTNQQLKDATERLEREETALLDFLANGGDTDGLLMEIRGKGDLLNLNEDKLRSLETNPYLRDAVQAYLSARNNFNNANIRYTAMLKGIKNDINQELDLYFAGIRNTDSEEDRLITYVDSEGKQWYVRSGLNEDGTLGEKMVILIDEEGNVDYLQAKDVDASRMVISDKESAIGGLRTYMQERITAEYGLGEKPATKQTQGAETMQPSAEAKQGDAEAEQPQAEAQQGEKPVETPEIQTDKDGNKLYFESGVEPKVAYDDIVNDLGGDREMAVAAIRGEVDSAGKALDKAEKKQVKSVAEAKAKKQAVEEAQARKTFWENVLEVENQRVAQENVERERQREAARAQEGAQGATDAIPTGGQQNVVPDWTVDKATDARARGYRMQNGERVDRQEPTEGVVGNEVEIDFTTGEKPVMGTLKVIESDALQPSHVGRQRNILHFIPEAQPKERTDAVSDVESDRIAQNMSPERITMSTNAYTGAPVVNERGEVIQGNNRANALRKMKNSPESRENYKKYLMEHAEEYGMKAEDIEKMQNPVLVREVKVADEEAIRLGQFKASDLETGGIERIEAKSTLAKMTNEHLSETMRRLFDSADEEKTIGQLIDDNGIKVLKYMRQIGAITDTQYQSAFNRKGELSEEARNDLRKLMLQNIFEGGSDRLAEAFEMLPAAAQKALPQAMASDMRLEKGDRLLPVVQRAIMAVAELKGSKALEGKTTYEGVKKAIEDASRQTDAFSGEPVTKKYSKLELELAARLLTYTQNNIKKIFSEYQRLIKGEGGGLFNPAEKLLREEAIKRVFDVEENNDTNKEKGTDDGTESKGRSTDDGNAESGQGNRGGGSQSEGKPAGEGGRAEIDSAVKQLKEKYDLSDEQIEELNELISKGKLSVSEVQRKLKAGFNKATDIVETLNPLLEGEKPAEAEEPVKPKTDIKNLSTEELEQRAKFLEVAAKTNDELYDNEEYVDIIDELEGRTNDLYDRVKDVTDEQIISALGGNEMLDAVKDAIEKLRKGEELGQIETGLLKAVALAKKEEAAKTADKANGEKPKAGVTKLSENGTLVVGGVPKQEEAPSPAKDVRREELKAEFDAAAQEAKDALLDFFTKPHGSDKASAMLIPVTEGQIKGFTRTVRAVGKLGYTAIKLGAYDFKTWCDRVLEQMGDFFREKLGWDEKNISDFLSEMWEMKFRLGDEVHTIKEWAESEKAKLAGDSAEYANRESKKDRFKNVVEKTLRESLVDESKRIKSITELRKIAKECGLENVRDTDLQEMVELAIVDIARKFEANKEISPKDRFDQVKRLYELQPSLNQRDTDRIMMQQYSTPAPMALLMGRFVNPDGKATSGLEPSAGNGMLTIGLPKEIMHVNEIDEVRLSNLRKQGFKAVTNQDGTVSFGGKKYKIVVTNPPFGSALPKEYDGYTISGLEHQMAINALESMEDDGRAAIIIGGRTEYAQNGAIKGRDKAFLSYLYQHYDVVDVINMDGKTLYARQGTGYSTRMILINGRRTGEDALNPHFPPVFSKARAELVSDYDELYKRIEDDILRNKDKSAGIRNGESGEGDRGNDRTDVAPADDKGVSGVRTTGRSEQPKSVATGGDLFSQPVGGGSTDSSKKVEGSGNAKGAGNDGVDKQPTPDNRGGQQPTETGRTATDESRQGGSGIPERPDNTQRPIGGNGEPVGNGQRRTDDAQPKRGLGTEKVPYRQQSSNPFSLHSLMPAEQADQVKAKLEELGDVDAFVTNELGYSSVEEMHAGLAAEQVDSVALAIHQMNNGSAFIIGDQTGIGKGRQAAALIRYGVKKGGCPVFITVKKGLFSDMYRDLCDIGSPKLRPFIWSADDKEHSANVTDANGNTIFARPNEKEQKRVVDYINKHGKLPPEYDYVVTTYDSFKSGTKEYENGEKKDRKFGKKQNPNNSTYKNGQAKRDALEALAKNSYVIMDESHNAGGEGSNVSGYLQYITAKAKGTTFLSATFAKRPGNMPIYSLRTAISKAGVAIGDLIDAVKRGGATFQEIMSKALTEAGQMIRRERDMTGVTIDWRGIEDEEVIQKQREQYDTVIGLFNEIIDFQKRYVDPIVNELNDEAADVMGEVNHTPGTRDMGINNTPFASRTYNIVQQVLLSLKAEESAKRAIEHMKQGRKAVIAVANTNEGAAGLASNMGEDMEMPDLSVNLKKGLEGVLRITNKNASGDRTNTMIPLERLSDEARQRYAEIMEHIESASSGLSLSPIDVMKNELRKAGYKVGELTGRTAEFVYNEDGTVRRVKRTDTDKKKIAAQFNNGELDALILNRSAGTGISLHASSKFKDQRPRIMIVAQAQGDVNDEVQIRGRIDRTGQVARGMYEYVVSNIPSEQRLLMMLKSKLRSLDANTTSSQKSKFNEMQVQDVMNKYGDEVLIQYLSEHPDTYAKLADPLKLGDGFEILSPEEFVKEAQKADGDGATASKILGRMALLTVKEQEAMLDDITELYTAEINRLNDMGENDLEITEMPLRAKTLDKKIWEEGAEPNSGNPFADNTYVETVEMDILKKPMKASEVKASQERLLNGRTYEEYRKEHTEKLDKWQEEKKSKLRTEYEERALRTAEKERERYLKAALKNREKSGMTEQQCEDMADAQYKIKYDGVMDKLDTQLRNVDIQRRAFDRVLEQFDTEHVYVLPSDIYDLTQIDFGSHFGKVIGIKISNNFSTASSTVTFATLDGRRKITVPVSGMVKNKNGEKSDLFKWIDINTKHVQQGIKGPNAANTLKVLEMSNENWDKMTSSATRKKGYIVTGNLLQALVSTKQQNISGKLISYTTDTGEIRQGLLMSDTFDPKSVTGTKPISDAYFVIAEQRQRVTSADGDVTIDWRYGDMYFIRVPKSVKSGGKYFQDAELLDIVDDNSFYTRGGGMFADIRGEENLKRVLDILSKKLKVGVQTDNEGNINPNPEVLHRQSGYTEEQKRRWDEKENRVMFDRIKKFADKTNISDRVELHTSADGLPEYAKSDKGWYDPQTGKIHIMINNHESREDVMHTLIHESVAHYGLRHLFGENFNTFLDEAYRAADNGIREAIDKIAKDKGLNTRTATEEYMAELTKEVNFEKPEVQSWWQNIKHRFADMLRKLGEVFDIKITDNELKYVLWRSYENMKDPKKYKSLRGKADDIAKRIELGIATEQERMVARSMEQDQTILHRKLDAKNAEDKKRIDDFEKSEKIKSYRSMQVIDGKLYPPMNAAFSGVLVEGLKPGDYDMAEEHPELAKPKKMRDGSTQYYFDLDKATKDATGKKATAVKGVLYDPYLHSKNNMLNDQFKSAWIRPNVVTVELEIAKNDLNSGYRAEKAGLSVGEHEWKPGTVAKELIKKGRHDGKLYLTQMAKIVRVVPDAEVAENIAKMVEGTGIEIPENVVQPKLRTELEKLGVKIGAPEKGTNKTEQIEQALQAGLEVQNTLSTDDLLLRRGDELPAKGSEEAVKYANDEFKRLSEIYKGKEYETVKLSDLSDEDILSICGTTAEEMEGYSEREVAEGLEWVRKYFSTKPAHFNRRTKKITIFADVISPENVEETHFHENIHGALDDKYGDGVREIAEKFWDIAPAEGKVSKEWVERKYEADEQKEEFFTYWLGRSMRDGDVEEMISMFSDKGDKESIDNILKTLGYDKGRENEERAFYKGSTEIREENPKLDDSRRVRGRREEIVERERTYAQGIVDGLGGKGKVVASKEELDAVGRSALHQNKNAKGWYNERTGEVTIYLPNCKSRHDAQRTILHEKVGHEGLEGMLGKENFRRFYNGLWKGLTPEQRAEISAKAQRNGWDYHEAMKEVLAEKAEDFTDSGRSFIQTVKDALNYVLAKIGFKTGMTEADVRTALWLSKNRLTGNTNNLSYKIARAAFEAKVKKHPSVEPTSSHGYKWGRETERDESGEIISQLLFSKNMKDSDREAIMRGMPPKALGDIRDYNRRFESFKYAWSESYGDKLAAARVLTDTILKPKKGERIDDRYDIAGKLEALSSANQVAQDNFRRRRTEPLFDYMNELQTNFDGETPQERYSNLEGYAYIKHGLERNRSLFVRDESRRLMQSEDADEVARGKQLQEDYDIKREDLYQDLRDGKITLRDFYDGLDEFIRTEIDDSYDASQRDMSGLSDTESERMRRLGVATDTKGIYNDAEAIDFVMDCESKMGKDKADRLWDMIEEIAKESVETQYQAGIINKAARDRMNSMFSWYIPLRGFDAKTAEEVYGYIGEHGLTPYHTNVKTQGRTSEAETPISTLCAMAEYSILRSNRNKVKQSLVMLARDKQSPLLTEFDTWYKADVENGERVLVPYYPELREDMTPEEIAQAIEQYEADIQQRKDDGETWMKLKDVKTNSPYRITKERNKNQHIVSSYINGQRVDIIVHGNPRAAQAINGLIHDTHWTGWDNINRFMSQLMTSYSLTFMMRNASRDYGFATLSGIVAESGKGEKWNRNFQKVYLDLMLTTNAFGEKVDASGNRTGLQGKGTGMLNLFKLYRSDKLDMNNDLHRYFKEFVEGGGMTGYTQMKGRQDYEEEIQKTIAEGFKEEKSTKLGKYGKMTTDALGKVVTSYFQTVERLNESVENHTRFAAFCASRMEKRTISRAISDAKNISVNFNRTGAGWGTNSLHTANETLAWKVNKKLAATSATYLRHAMWFFNPAVQGMKRNLDLAFGGNKAQTARYVGIFLAMPASLSLIASGASAAIAEALDDDDDKKKYGENPYDQLPDYVRRNNVCLYLGHGRWFTVPLAIEIRAAYGLADVFSRAVRGVPSEKGYAAEAFEQITQLTPMDLGGGGKVAWNGMAGSVLGTVTPSNLQPLIACATNVKWTGSPVHNRRDYNSALPEWQRALSTTDDNYIAFSKMLSEMTGYENKRTGTKTGNDVQAGWLDINPGICQYLVESYIGGPGKDLTEVTRYATDKVKDVRDYGWSSVFNSEGKADFTRLPVIKAFTSSPRPENARGFDRARWYAYRNEYDKETKPQMQGYKKKHMMTEYTLMRNSKAGRIGHKVDRYEDIVKRWTERKNKSENAIDKQHAQWMINENIRKALEEIDTIEKE